ncbi:MAG: ribonuclease D [Coriobacteriales bacterium]|nr:ribonuclease D [Coriobacteriales bacterium]
MYIDTRQALEDFIVACKGESVLAIDTEFLREKTYYPQLCLLQFAVGKQVAIIDPLVPLDLGLLAPLLTDERIIKVFHAGDQDRAILYHELGTAVRPVFDTQRASLLLGLPQQMSLVALVKHFCGISLRKGESFSDWSQRPLTKTQLDYALDDVRYLPAIYEKMVADLTANGRLGWLREDFRAMEDEERYRTDIREVWRKLKGASSLGGSKLATVREVAAWRETVAQKRNLPRKWIIPDDLLVEVAKREPDSLEALFRIRGLRERLGKNWSQELLRAIVRGSKQPSSEWPVRERPVSVDANATAKLDLMNALLHHRARELRIASSFLVSHDELVQLAAGRREGLQVLGGWRRDLIGDELLRLLEGEVSLSLTDRELKVTLLSQARLSSAQ